MKVIDELESKLKNINKSFKDIDRFALKIERLNIFDELKEEVIIANGEEVIPDYILQEEYYDSYGTQELYGYITFKDGTWLERAEYDGAEWWEYKTLPNYIFTKQS